MATASKPSQNAIVCTILGMIFCFICCGGMGIGFYLTGCDPTGYCKSGTSTATATGYYPTEQNRCTGCKSHGCSSYVANDDCCEYYDYTCWDSYAEFSSDKGICKILVDSNSANEATAIVDAAARYPKGSTIEVQEVSDDGDLCTTIQDARVNTYFGITFMCIASIILCSFVILVWSWCKTGAFNPVPPPTETSPSDGRQMMVPPPLSYPYSTYLPSEPTGGQHYQPAVMYGPPGPSYSAYLASEPTGGQQYQPAVMYGPPGPSLMYHSLPNQYEPQMVQVQPTQGCEMQAFAVAV